MKKFTLETALAYVKRIDRLTRPSGPGASYTQLSRRQEARKLIAASSNGKTEGSDSDLKLTLVNTGSIPVAATFSKREIIRELKRLRWRCVRGSWNSPHFVHRHQGISLREAASLEFLTSNESLT